MEKNDPPPPPVEEKNDPGGTISISGNAFGENTKVTRGRREREGGREREKGEVVAIYNANGNSHKYSGRGFNGLRYIPDTYAGNDACMRPVERRGEIIFFFHSFPLPSSPRSFLSLSGARPQSGDGLLLLLFEF